ncbi:DNA repair and recombination protein RAD54B, partial [Stegodyphus mimosarum]
MCVNKDTESNARSDEEILKLISEVDEGKTSSVNAIETISTTNFQDDDGTESLFEPYMFSQKTIISSKLDVLNHRINEYNSKFPKESEYNSESKNKTDAFQNPDNIKEKDDLDSQRVSSPKSFEYKIYSVLYCKRSSKKHKIWEGDGVLIVQNRSAILKDMEGKEIARAVGYKLKDTESLEEGSKFFIGGKECEIQYQMSEEEQKQNKSLMVLDVESPPKTVHLHKQKSTTRRFYSPLRSLKSQEKADIKPEVFDENVLVLPHP